MSMLVDYQNRTATHLMHSQKMAMQMDLTRTGTDVPHCGDKDIDACFASQGYKKQMQAPMPGQGPRGAGAFKASDSQGKTPEQIRELIQKQQSQFGAHAPGEENQAE